MRVIDPDFRLRWCTFSSPRCIDFMLPDPAPYQTQHTPTAQRGIARWRYLLICTPRLSAGSTAVNFPLAGREVSSRGGCMIGTLSKSTRYLDTWGRVSDAPTTTAVPPF